ncbi:MULTISPECIES: hypothetical protein [unclassified Nostoc]|uniref:hypothetical protein n=1 Tax=unclassified Nostoc TaxID=2593658 RepID=UPI002AD2F136|nr:hypothetical protein [Nostoc sp. DedQUE03]MDZ7973801.1 hypothetical protein [Nostoc sp. DedQUE03]MDZ8048587.1 hypothetical protein [Nostoc sp. DedQUE02]
MTSTSEVMKADAITGEQGLGIGEEAREQGSKGEVVVSLSPLPLCPSAFFAQSPIPNPQI